MALHMSARLAWHNDGWNGCVCQNPQANTWCVGASSYPGEMIREQRDLDWECRRDVAGKPCKDLEQPPPCMYSVNAFGLETIRVKADPPGFFGGGADSVEWDISPSTVCVWPYEVMFGDDVKSSGKFDYDKRLANAITFFNQFEPAKSLIVYYANYSNPFSENEQQRYVIVGISRIKSILPETIYYENTTPDIQKRYAGGFVWQKPVTSAYPEEGFRIPYHRYMDHPDVLERLLAVPENPRNFKYATRAFSDDDALVIVEQLLETVAVLQEIGDECENWDERRQWLESLVSELWRSRGLYPGTPRILDYLGLQDGIPWFKQQVAQDKEKAAHAELFRWLSDGGEPALGLAVPTSQRKSALKRWLLLDENTQELLRDVLSRFDLQKEQMEQIISGERAKNGIESTVDEMIANPYVLCEEYVGNDPDDLIGFNRIDHGVFPNQDLGGENLADKDDTRRLRALCVTRLNREGKHTFLPADQVIHDINRWLSFQPEWKRHQFTEKYFRVDREELEKALVFRELEEETKEGTTNRLYLYTSHTYEDERTVEKSLRFLANGPDISFRSPVTESHWGEYLWQSDSAIATKSHQWYDQAIKSQAELCARIFPRPLSVVSGAAGTGKTTVVKAVIQAIEKAHGSNGSFQLLAPTGKAADRLRDLTGKSAATLHSFLARHGWLNRNMTFKREGGHKEKNVQTYIIDESSMLNLELTAAFFRAVDWQTVQRFILVGDPNQLPPIGRGRFFADVIDWLRDLQPEAVAVLSHNMRQKENELDDQGTGILRLASLYTEDPLKDTKDTEDDAQAEQVLADIQETGDIDKDLRVLFWDTPEELEETLMAEVVADAERTTGLTVDPAKPYEIWNKLFGKHATPATPEAMQILTPYRGEQFGTENINRIFQETARSREIAKMGSVDGITIGDKVIQARNRPKSNPLHAWNRETSQNEEVEIFNGELGVVVEHGCDKKRWNRPDFRLNRFQVLFSRKSKYRVSYGSGLGKGCPSEPPESNLELAYGISIHKAQGSEFDHVYFVVPKDKTALLSRELFYTGMTRATRHCTLLIQEDITPLLRMRRKENSHLLTINSSLFRFSPVPDALMDGAAPWRSEGRIHHTLTKYLVRSKSEVIISNLLHERDIDFFYERQLKAPDGTFYLPDFTIIWRGNEYYWEHVGNINEEYRNHWETKKAWYEKHFPGQLLTTEEGTDVTTQAKAILDSILV